MKTDPAASDGRNTKKLTARISSLEKRVAALESGSNEKVSKPKPTDEEEGFKALMASTSEGKLEASFGEFGLAWLGNLVLLFGMVFIIQYLQVQGLRLLSPLFGFAAATGVFSLAYYFRSNNPYIAKIFDLNGYLLLYWVILKMHFFNPNPLIAAKFGVIVLLLIFISILVYRSVKKSYPALTGVSMFLLAFTALLSDNTLSMLALAAVISVVAIVFLKQYGWIRQVYLAIFLSYLICIFWMLGNPIMGNESAIVQNHELFFFFLFFIAALFSLIALMPRRDESYGEGEIVSAMVLNGLWFSLMLLLVILSFYKDNYILPMTSVTIYAITYSVVLKVHSKYRISPALYALFGFVALSITLYGIFGFPNAYFFLIIQSLLVVSMALWFRSKFIIIMNGVLFVILLLIYFTTSASIDSINFSLGVVALLTARVLNWQKERLDIQTDLLRNLYLLIAFPMVLYSFYKLLPGQYVTVSWTGVALLYFLLSLILSNVKYRYMALGTMIAAALYLFLFDLARIDLIYRILALLFLALISIGLSLYYARKKNKATPEE